MQRATFRARQVGISRRGFVAGSAAATAAFGVIGKARASGGSVNVWNWAEYFAESTLEDFTNATGITVNLDTFASNSELVDGLKDGNPGYDVVFPSSEYVEQMVRADMLEPLDYARLENVINIDPFFMDAAYDRGRTYSLPYFWGTVGLGYRRSVSQPRSWREVFDPDIDIGRISLIGEWDTLQAALKFMGHSANTTDPALIRAAADIVIAARHKIVAFPPDEGYLLLGEDVADVVMDWNGAILMAMDEDEDIGFIIPEEGSTLWEDTMCIPRGAPNPENAHAFIDFLMRAEVHSSIAAEIMYASPNLAAQDLLPPEDLANEAIYPSSEVLARCEPAFWLGEEVNAIYQQEMQRVLNS